MYAIRATSESGQPKTQIRQINRVRMPVSGHQGLTATSQLLPPPQTSHSQCGRRRSRLTQLSVTPTSWFKSMWSLAPADSTTPAGSTRLRREAGSGLAWSSILYSIDFETECGTSLANATKGKAEMIGLGGSELFIFLVVLSVVVVVYRLPFWRNR